MSEAEAVAIGDWHYAEPYAFYDFRRDPDDLAELLDPGRRAGQYYAAHDTTGALIGFFQFTHEQDTTIVGLGLRPDLTGRGRGQAFLRAGLAFAWQQFAPRSFALSVATFNQRAIRVYRREGFQISRIFMQTTNGGQYEFAEMVRRAEPVS